MAGLADILRKALSYGSQTAPKVIDDVAEEAAGPVAKRLSTEATEVGPKVIGKGVRPARAADDIMDADFTEITPTTGMDDMRSRMNPNLAKIAATLGLVGGGAMLMDGDEEAILPPEELAKVKDIATPPIAPDNIPVPSPKVSPKVSPAPTPTPSTEVAAQEASIPDFVRMIQAAQGDAASRRNMADLLRSSEMLAAGIARIKPEHSSSDIKRKEAGQPVEDIKGQISAYKEQQSFDKMKADLQDDNKLRDSGSDISKTARDIAKKLGINVSDKTSAKQLQDAGLPLGTLLSTKMAADSRREMAQLMKEQKTAKQAKDLSQQQRKFVQGLRKEATTGVLGKQYATFSTGQRLSSALDEFRKNPSGYKDYATLMGGLKALQGDESVVREAEIRLGMSAASAIDTAMNYMQRAMTGKSLQPGQREEIANTIKTLTDASRLQYMQSVAPILEQAEIEGIDPNLILSGSLSGAKSSSKPSESQDLTTGTVKVRRLSDGKTKEMPAASAAKMDKTLYEIIE